MGNLMVAAHIRNLSLLELFYTCVANHTKIINQLELEILEVQKHYIAKDDYNTFIYYKRELNITERTLLVMHDAEKLFELCNGEFDDTSEYQLLIRLLKEQTTFDNNGHCRLRKRKKFRIRQKCY